MRLFVILLQIIGEEVQRSKPEKFAELLLKMRQMLVSDNLTPVSRCVLLHILELHLLRWQGALFNATAAADGGVAWRAA